MPYIKRKSGVIVGVFKRKQSGVAEDFLPDDDPEVIAFKNPPLPSNNKIYDETIKNQSLLKAFVMCINDGSIVPGANVNGAQLKAAIKDKM